MIYFKIRDRRNGLYSMGGSTPRWSTRGKTWTTGGALSSHLAQLRRYHLDTTDNWEVVSFELREVSAEPVAQRLESIRQRQQKRQDDFQRRQLKWARERDLAELKRLQDKLGVG